MDEVFEIREFYDVKNDTINSEVVDVYGEYNKLRSILQSNQKEGDLNTSSADVSSSPNSSTRQKIVETLCERLNPDTMEIRPEADVSIMRTIN